MALTGSEQASRLPRRSAFGGGWERLVARFGSTEHQLVQRLAGTVFLIRVAAALMAYATNVLFARWMGTFEFGGADRFTIPSPIRPENALVSPPGVDSPRPRRPPYERLR